MFVVLVVVVSGRRLMATFVVAVVVVICVLYVQVVFDLEICRRKLSEALKIFKLETARSIVRCITG